MDGYFSKMLLEKLKNDIDPCDNFYEFACGNWMERNQLLKTETPLNVFAQMKIDYERELRTLLEKPVPDNSPRFLKMLKAEYDTCLDLGDNQKLGYAYLIISLKKLGGWPVVMGDKWNEIEFDYINALINITKMGLGRNYLIQVSVTSSKENASLNLISLGFPTFLANQPSLNQIMLKLTIKKYLDDIKKNALQLNKIIENKDEELRRIYEFETTLLEATTFVEEGQNPGIYTLKQLENMLPQINWKTFFRELIDPLIDENQAVHVTNVIYLKTLFEVMSKTPKRTVANYLLWRVVKSSLYLFNNSGDCFSFVNGNNLHIALASAYIKFRSFDSNMRNRASEIIHYIRKTVIKGVTKLTWLSSNVKKRAIIKIKNTIVDFPFVAELLNDTLIDEFYSNLTFSRKSYFLNVVSIKKWLTDTEFHQLRKINTREDWKSHVGIHLENTFFDHYPNTIKVGLGIIRDPVFNTSRPNYMNFGSIGSIIAHEFFHGILPPGNTFDVSGNSNKWWDNETDILFSKVEQCIIEQYDNYSFSGSERRINGENTVVENFADNVGWKSAYNAYLFWEKQNGAEPTLSHSNYTSRQLFWLSVAKVWCGNNTSRKEGPIHSPGMFRVIGSFSNIKEFSEDFNCPVGSPMNPVKKCGIV